MRQDGLKSDVLNGSQDCCLRTERVQEGLSHPGAPTLGRGVWGPGQRSARDDKSHLHSWKQRPASGFGDEQELVDQLSEGSQRT